MKKYLPLIGKSAITLALAGAGFMAGQHIWDYYMDAPWTRDGRIGADIIQLTPDVSGLISEVGVRENQVVKPGQLLFTIDRSRYEVALHQAETALKIQRVALRQARRDSARNRSLAGVVAAESIEQGDAHVQTATAALANAENALRLAQLNLERTAVRSPVAGFLSDRVPRVGEYVSAGHPVMSVLDVQSFHVIGYFEETKLNHVKLNQAAEVRVMGDGRTLRGHVQSIAAGIEDRERSNGASMLPNVNPSFNWVRLAQRIPVRIALDAIPRDSRLIAGRTATVAILQGGAR